MPFHRLSINTRLCSVQSVNPSVIIDELLSNTCHCTYPNTTTTFLRPAPTGLSFQKKVDIHICSIVLKIDYLLGMSSGRFGISKWVPSIYGTSLG